MIAATTTTFPILTSLVVLPVLGAIVISLVSNQRPSGLRPAALVELRPSTSSIEKGVCGVACLVGGVGGVGGGVGGVGGEVLAQKPLPDGVEGDVGVGVDNARQDGAPLGVHHDGVVRHRKPVPDGLDALSLDEQIGLKGNLGGDERAILDE